VGDVCGQHRWDAAAGLLRDPRLQERLPVSAYRRPLLGTGLCGALTTFSTMQLEVLRMLSDGRTGLAVAYVLTSIGVGFVGVFLATALVRRVRTLA
jgi:fluoride exporter